MRQAWSFLLMGWTMLIASGTALSGCSGEEIGIIEGTGSNRDGALDTQAPTNDRIITDGLGGRGGTGTGGRGGTGGSGGTVASGGTDAGRDDGPDDDGSGPSDDVHTDNGSAGDGRD